MRSKPITATLILATTLGLGSSMQAATTHTVCASGCDFTLIQTAVIAAAPGDTVQVFVADDHTESGILINKELTIEGLGQDLTVVQAHPDSRSASNRVFLIATPQGQAARFRDLTIRHGYTAEGGCLKNLVGSTVFLERVSVRSCVASDQGGGIYNEARLFLQSSQVSGNDSDFQGGGIYNAHPGTLELNESWVSNNYSGGPPPNVGSGAGIYNAGLLYLRNSHVNDNRTRGSVDDTRGGGIYNHGTLWSSGSEIKSNEVILENFLFATGGAGIFHYGGSMQLRDTKVAQNLFTRFECCAQGQGVGIYIGEDAETLITDSEIHGNWAEQVGIGAGIFKTGEGELVIERTLFKSNYALIGGGMYLDLSVGDTTIRDSTFYANDSEIDGAGAMVCDSSVEFANSTLTDNRANGNGGGIFACSSSSVFLANTTLSNNYADYDADNFGDGGAVYSIDGAVTALNSLVSGNHDRTHILSSNGPDCAGEISSVGYNLIASLGYESLINPVPLCEITGTTTGNLVGTPETLGNLNDYWGPTPVHPLLPDSLSVDSAHPAGCWDLFLRPLDEDQRGYIRQDHCDRGSFELGAEQPAEIFVDDFESPSNTSSWSDEYPWGPVSIDWI